MLLSPHVALLSAFQGRGIGTGILRALQDRAQGEGKPLSLHVQRGNDGAAALYRRLGFTLAEPGATHDHFIWTAGESQGQSAVASQGNRVKTSNPSAQENRHPREGGDPEFAR